MCGENVIAGRKWYLFASTARKVENRKKSIGGTLLGFSTTSPFWGGGRSPDRPPPPGSATGVDQPARGRAWCRSTCFCCPDGNQQNHETTHYFKQCNKSRTRMQQDWDFEIEIVRVRLWDWDYDIMRLRLWYYEIEIMILWDWDYEIMRLRLLNSGYQIFRQIFVSKSTF